MELEDAALEEQSPQQQSCKALRNCCESTRVLEKVKVAGVLGGDCYSLTCIKVNMWS